MRKYISIVLAVLLIVIAVMIFKKLANKKKKKPTKIEKIIKIAQTKKVENKTIPLHITTSGTLKAKNKIDLFTEVQGIVLGSSKRFKEGTFFNKGETILRINSEEFAANLRAQKSNFYSVLTAMMPDLQLDFPEVYPKWKSYLANFDMQKSLPPLPQMQSDKEKYFITGRKVLTTYYSVKNAEARLSKFSVKAPFSGVLSQVMVNQGTLIRPGQKLGTFVNTFSYELEVNINTEYANFLQKGKRVALHNLENTQTFTGVVTRINPIVDTASQSIKLYIEVKDKSLREGMYLEADVSVKAVEQAFQLSRKLLVEETYLYVIQDSVLHLQAITPVFFTHKDVIVRGLKDGQDVLISPVPGAYEGMQVTNHKE